MFKHWHSILFFFARTHSSVVVMKMPEVDSMRKFFTARHTTPTCETTPISYHVYQRCDRVCSVYPYGLPLAFEEESRLYACAQKMKGDNIYDNV